MVTKEEKIKKLAADILRLSRNTLLVNLRFLDMALSRFTLVPYEETTIATDGKFLAYNPLHVLKIYKAEKAQPVRDYLHVVFHCVFRHMYINTLINQPCWDLACDIAVENIINELGLKAVETPRQHKQSAVIDELKKEVKQLTAEKIYRYYCNKNFSENQLEKTAQLFRADDHSIWYLPPEEKIRLSISLGGQGNLSGNENGKEQQVTAKFSVAEQDWKEISERMQQDLETFSKQQGDRAGNLIQNLSAINREKYDYTAFLKKFAVMGEAMKINDDEFDYIYYTYGLNLYEKMPLVEPLEYKDVKRIKEFVIAIDTSGSVSGELVQTFVQKTYNILKSTESFFSKINLHIIQCDTEIQEDVKITCQKDFDNYLATMKLKGFGGTDFRPVFNYVDTLIKNKEFTNLKGLIYFTDGYGDFPQQKPQYETAFVFIDDEYNNPDVPPWAIKLVLQKEEI